MYVGLVMVLSHLTLQIGKNMEYNVIILYPVVGIWTLAGILALEGEGTWRPVMTVRMEN